jgi:thymidylate synthase
MALPPCHSLFQFYVDTDAKEISCELYQRSADAFLGVPFNIASYALLIYIIGNITGYKPKEFVHTFGDLHIYQNHLEQVKLQLKRTVRELPKLVIKRKLTNVEDITINDFEIVNYNPDDPIKADMAV